MDYLAILALVQKGITVAQALMEVSKDASPALTAIKNMLSGLPENDITDEQMLAVEELLDAQIAEFNLEIED
jgi:hypothetical protein